MTNRKRFESIDTPVISGETTSRQLLIELVRGLEEIRREQQAIIAKLDTHLTLHRVFWATLTVIGGFAITIWATLRK